MEKDPLKKETNRSPSWVEEQQTKSLFFLAKLHEWGLREVAAAIEQFDGSTVEWNRQELNISERAWNKVIHRGIAPVRVFAHPVVIQTVPQSVGYYRMLAMVSQKSMKRVGLDTEPYETGDKTPDENTARSLAPHLNRMISRLIENDIDIDLREFDLWRGMAAGSQAQGSWQNAKGKEYESIVRQILVGYLQESGSVHQQSQLQVQLRDGRVVLFGSDPDICLTRDRELLSAVEIKGGIDPAGAHERLGASLKTLRDCRANYPDCTTILLLRRETLTEGLAERIKQNREDITYWFALEDILEDDNARLQFVKLFLREVG